MLAPILALAVSAPDPVPVLDIVRGCDASKMRIMVGDEPRRRTEFAAAVYAEQRAIGSDRARLLAQPTTPQTTPSDQATTALAAVQIDARQKELDDTRATDKAWRELFDDARADYLANCSSGKHDAKDK